MTLIHGHPTTNYRIDRRAGDDEWVEYCAFHGTTLMDVAEYTYDSLRNDNQGTEFRLVQVTEQVVRSGKGRVYE